ncbi:hypothetical protein BDZ91DRAFT_729637 [Kalaharituber pfeilii]|nr:hypothetical protein BDZ91DRAFT_729637 [Kalaharituber pfeilii]
MAGSCCENAAGRTEDVEASTTGPSTVVPTPASSTIGDDKPADVSEVKEEKPQCESETATEDKQDAALSDDGLGNQDEPPPEPMKPRLINLITKYDASSGEYVTVPATKNNQAKNRDEFAGYALTLTSAFNTKGEFTRKLLEIKAPVLKQLCVDIIGDSYPGQSFKTEQVVLNCPPKPLFFHYKRFEEEQAKWQARLEELKEKAAKEEAEKKEKGEEEEKPAAEKEKEKVEDEDEDEDAALEAGGTRELFRLNSYLERSLEELTDDLKYLNLFIRFIHTELRNEIATYNSLVPQGLISYDLLWTIFPPLTRFLTHVHNGEPAVYLLHKGVEVTEGCNPRFHLDSFCVDHDGLAFGYSAVAAAIPPFEGTMPIASLPCIPLQHVPDLEAVIAELTERGRKAERLQASGPSYMTFKGRALGPIVNQRRTYYSINGRVMIDPATFARINPERAITINSLQSVNPFASEEDRYSWNRARDPFEDGFGVAKVDLETNNTKHEFVERILTKEGKFYIPLTDDQALLVNPYARGFALSEKKWAEFALSQLQEVVWAPDAFDKLVLPEEQKELILSLVEARTESVSSGTTQPKQTDNKYNFDDFIPSKGLGLVAVLHGPPGVGKTLTAESVAEYTRRPLYSVTSGELGTEPEGLERTLAEILEVAGTWNAILLIDEADIFLEARGVGNSIVRNAMVGIFLRLLEYFRGVMFLTTNRVEKFDPAFKSRIHMAMRYQDLTEEARTEVWRNFLGKLPKEALEEGLLTAPAEGEEPGIVALAKKWDAVNGREIKNAVKTGLRIAARRETKLSSKILEGVLRLGGEFDAQMRADSL